jgi:hypothetical protein
MIKIKPRFKCSDSQEEKIQVNLTKSPYEPAHKMHKIAHNTFSHAPSLPPVEIPTAYSAFRPFHPSLESKRTWLISLPSHSPTLPPRKNDSRIEEPAYTQKLQTMPSAAFVVQSPQKTHHIMDLISGSSSASHSDHSSPNDDAPQDSTDIHEVVSGVFKACTKRS